MSLEIERKFCIPLELLKRLKNEGLLFHKEKLSQFYTSNDAQNVIRFRRSDDTYQKTTKSGTGMVRQEVEQSVTKEDFEEAKAHMLGFEVNKTRYNFKLQNHKACIDLFHEKLDGLVCLEVEFDNEEEAKNFELPHVYNLKIVEVTDDEAYKNHNLSLNGNPQITKNLNKQLQNVKNGNFELKALSENMNSYGAMRVIFYHLFNTFSHYYKLYMLNKKEEDLHQFRVTLRRTRSLLQSNKTIFEEHITKKFIKEFGAIASITNDQRDLDVINIFLEVSPAQNLKEYFLERAKKESTVVVKALKGVEHSHAINEWKMVLDDEEGFFKGEDAQLSYKELGQKSIKKIVKRIIKKIKELEHGVPLEFFHEVRIEFKRLRYLIEFYEELFADKLILKVLKRAKVMQDIFGILQDRDTQAILLREAEVSEELSGDVQSILWIENLLDMFNSEVYILKSEVIYNKDKLIASLKKSIEDL